MISNRIRCLSCGHEGSREILGIGPIESKEFIFREKGHNPYTGDLYFLCPQCGIIVSVNPTDVLGKDTANGYPVSLETHTGRFTKSKDFLPRWKDIHPALLLLF